MSKVKSTTIEVGGKQIIISTGKYAKQATAAVEVRCNNTVLLVSVTKSKTVKAGIDYFPLLVDFEEKMYSVGKIPGGWFKREGKASDKAVLVSRLIDRPMRPLFPDSYRNDVQINAMTLSTDYSAPSDILAMIGAGFALELSGLPTSAAVGAVRISRDAAGKFIVNPSDEELKASDLDIIVAATKDSVMMVEAGASFVPDEIVISAIEFAQKEVAKQVVAMEAFAKECGVTKEVLAEPVPNAELVELVKKLGHEPITKAIGGITDKKLRNELFDKAHEDVKNAVAELVAARGEDDTLVQYLAANPAAAANEIKQYEKKLLRKQISETGVRADGRKPTEVRPISVEVGQLPAVHGDGLFTRGDTQVLSILTLGPESECKKFDSIDSETEKYYMHNYNFPGWSVGEVKPNRGPGRREVGHGALAERAVEPSPPSRDDFPYAIRVVSEVLESAGSTSMASTCASSLALMNGGVPVKCPVAGVAMGLIKEGDKATVLTDIQDIEDFLGDMDFKVAGNDAGVSALQMDIKIQGIPMAVIRKAIEQGRDGRLHILGEMAKVISKPGEELRPTAPRIISTQIEQERIGAVIGSQGKNIKWILAETGAEINIDDTGKVSIYSLDPAAGARALELVELMANGVKEGEVWTVKIVKILDGVGAIGEIVPGVSGLIHISQIAMERVNRIEDFLKIDDEVEALVIGVDTFKGRISLSTRAMQERAAQAELAKA